MQKSKGLLKVTDRMDVWDMDKWNRKVRNHKRKTIRSHRNGVKK